MDSIRKALILGGTADTGPLAQQLAHQGWQVCVSTFSDAPLELGHHPLISRRTGPLNALQLQQFLEQGSFDMAIDALHPYAEQGHATAQQVAQMGHCRWLALERPATPLPEFVELCAGHSEAVQRVSQLKEPVLLTIGSRYLEPYVQACQALNIPFLARVLNDPASCEVCQNLGLDSTQWVAERGPFRVEQNLFHMKQVHARVMVTKDGGSQGGMPEKLQAAQLWGCHVLAIARPRPLHAMESYASISQLIQAL